MHSSDIEFIRQYKRLDKLCGELYSCRDGVGAYINDMENEYVRGLRSVTTWAYDFKMLKHVHWVKNKIEHEPSRHQTCEDADIDFVYDFYDRVYDGGDPISLFEEVKKEEAARQRGYGNKRTDRIYGSDDDGEEYTPASASGKKSGCSGCLVLTALLGAAILAGLIYLIFFLK